MDSTGAGSGIGNPLSIIKAGESLDFIFDRGGQSVEGWLCQLNVLRFPGQTPEISRFIELDDNSQWSGFLTSVETAGLLSRGIYRMVGLLTNSATNEEEQIPVRFQRNKAWV